MLIRTVLYLPAHARPVRLERIVTLNDHIEAEAQTGVADLLLA